MDRPDKCPYCGEADINYLNYKTHLYMNCVLDGVDYSSNEETGTIIEQSSFVNNQKQFVNVQMDEFGTIEVYKDHDKWCEFYIEELQSIIKCVFEIKARVDARMKDGL